MQKNCVEECDSFYLLGIGGVSMSALARLLKALGKRVCGCDREESAYTQSLRADGIYVRTDGFDQNFGGCQVIAYTDAIDSGDKWRVSALRSGRQVVSRGELLAALSGLFSTDIAVAGSHGKSTCTSMTAHIFRQAGKRFACHIGGEDRLLKNAFIDGRDYFITEACEYKRNLLWLHPDIAVVLNTDPDHLDCYGNAENVLATYRTFCAQSKSVIKLYGELGGIKAVTFGFDDRADYHGAALKENKGRYAFSLYEEDTCLGDIQLKIYGKHNVLNALAAAAVARQCGISFEDVRLGLEGYEGLARRFEPIGTIGGVKAIADYAHHPAEIKAAVRTAAKLTDGKLYVIFQPHTYSRTKTLFPQFVGVLSNIPRLLIYRTYAAREYFDDGGSALTLSRAVKRSVYADSIEGICSFLRGAGRDDLLLVLGAGDIYDIALTLADR